MGVHERIQYLRREHDEIARVLDTFEEFLARTSRADMAARATGLADLRSFDHHLAGILEHCHAEDRAVESVFHQFLQERERNRVVLEHEDIVRLVDRFRDELKFATIDRCTTMTLWGDELVDRLRTHIAFEGVLLNRIDALSALPEDVLNRFMHADSTGNQLPAN